MQYPAFTKLSLASLLFLLMAGVSTAQIKPEEKVEPTRYQLLKDSLIMTSERLWADLKQRDYTRETEILKKSGIAVIGISGLGLLSYEFADQSAREFMMSRRTKTTVTISKYIEPLGRMRYLMPATGVLYAGGLALKDKKLQRAAMVAFLSLQVNDLVTGQLKDEFQRKRPDVTHENNHFLGGEAGRLHSAMPSSHTSSAFTLATVLATAYKDTELVPVMAYATASLVGLSRVHDNKHWTTDVLAGAIVGFASAKVTDFTFTQMEKLLKRKNINIYLSPQASKGSAGLGMLIVL